MSQFTDIMQTNPPRVVVQYQNNRFSWGITGNGIPVVSLIGFINVVQNALADGKAWESCAGMQLVIAWDGNEFHWAADLEIPLDPLTGTLEMIKQILVAGQLEQMLPQKSIVGPDGLPMRR